MASKSHYDLLGVARHADAAVVQAAYRALAKLYHPDVARGPKDLAAARFRAINEAYEVLADARQRVKYDAQLDALLTESQAPPAPRRPTRGPRMPVTEQPYPGAPEWRRVLLITLGIVVTIQIALAILGIPETVSSRNGSGGRVASPMPQKLEPGTVLRFDNKGNLIGMFDSKGNPIGGPGDRR
jgi:DnaJ-domain-containing protein 1